MQDRDPMKVITAMTYGILKDLCAAAALCLFFAAAYRWSVILGWIQ